jgi:HAD superfamily hydrolase (TIGR01509 family)
VAGSIELVIFDCDGVLVDSEPIAVRVDREVLASVGLEMSDAEVIERFVGRSATVMLGMVEQHLGHVLSPEQLAGFEQLYIDAFEAELEPISGIEQALDGLSYPTCVASSSSPVSIRRKLARTGLLDRFEGRIFSATEVAHGKPAPDLFLYAAERMGVPPARCAVIEDSTYGVQAARAAAMRTYAYVGGLIPGDSLAGPDTVLFDDMRLLPELLACAA